jgi:ribosome biogenesis GTPase
MTSSQKEFLIQFGWNDFFENQLAEFYQMNPGMNPEKLKIARVVNEEKNLYRIQLNAEEIYWSAVSGKMQFSAQNRSSFPAVGDWVLVEIPEQSDRGIIRFVLRRKSALVRKQVGNVSDVQILAANVDTVFITTALNGDLNIGRLERYLTFAWDSGARPVILLTKTDLFEGSEESLAEMIQDLKLRFCGVEIHSMNRDDFAAAEFFNNYLVSGTTSVLVGSSGVGKSTISNFLVGRDVLLTSEVRECDGKGRHTTTSRSLYESRFGGLIIDTPGMRELQFAGHVDGLEVQFADIELLVKECRYNNCTHTTEQNCAIQTSLEEGSLEASRWKSYKKIAGEIKHGLMKENKWMMAEQRKVWKKKSMDARNRSKGW